MLREILASAAKIATIEANSLGPISGSLAIHNLANGSASGDAVNKGQLDLKLDASLVGANNGVASLDSGGKIPLAQLPASLMEYQGVWDASSNTPTLADGTGSAGFFYRANVAGTQNLGSGSQTFVVGDWVMYDGAVWQLAHAGSDVVISVNGQAGVVVLAAGDIGYDNSSSGFAATDTQAAIDELNGLVLKKDGSVAMTGDLDLGTNQIHNVVDPSSAQDAATKNYVDTQIVSASGANTTLSNLTSPTAINQHLLAGTLFIDLGNGTIPFRNIYGGNTISAPNVVSSSVLGLSPDRGSNNDTFLQYGGSMPSGATVYTSLASAHAGNFGVYTVASAVATGGINVETGNSTGVNSSATGSLSLSTGNKTNGTGNSGSISLTTGTSAGGVRGNIVLNGASIDASSTNIINVTDPSNAQDAATKNYVDTGLAAYLPLNGTASDVDMNNHAITNASDLHANTIESDGLLTAGSGFSVVAGTMAISMGVSVDFGTNSVTNVADPTSPQDAATKNYVDNSIVAAGGANTSLSNLASVAVNTHLVPGSLGFNLGSAALPWALGFVTAFQDGSGFYAIDVENRQLDASDNTMMIDFSTAGQIAVGSNKIINLSDPTNAQDAATKNYVDTAALLLAGGTMSGAIDMNYAAGIQHATDVRSEQINVIDGSDSSALTLQNSGGNGVIQGNGVFIQSSGTPNEPVRDLNLQSASDMHINAGGSYYSGTIAGTATAVVIQANISGNANNGLVFTFDGTTSIDNNLAVWNTANPDNQIFTRRGDGSQIPSAGTITLDGAGIFSVQSQLDMSSLPITSVLDPVNAQDAATKNYVDTQIVSASGANTALSNLASVAINTDLLPDGASHRNLGSSSKPWWELFVFDSIKNGAGAVILDIQDGILFDSSGNRSVEYEAHALRDSSNVRSVDYDGKQLTIGGTSMFNWATSGVLDAKTNRLINIADPVNAQDAVSKGYLGTNYANVSLSNLGATSVNTDILPDGDLTRALGSASLRWTVYAGSMQNPGGNLNLVAGSGDSIHMYNAVDMGSNQINNLVDPTSAQDAATKNYVDSAVVAGIVVDGNAIQNLAGTISLVLDGSTLSASASGLKVASGGVTDNEIASGANIALTKLAALTASYALVSDGSGVIVVSGTTATELGYVAGVTSGIQSQLDAKLNLSGGTMSGQLNMGSQKIVSLSAGTGTGDAVNYDQVMLLSGVNAMGAAMDMGSHQIHNVSDPSSAQDAATMHYFTAIATSVVPAGDSTYNIGANGFSFQNGYIKQLYDAGGNLAENINGRLLVADDGSTAVADWHSSSSFKFNVPVNMNTHKITGLVDPTAGSQEAATAHYVDTSVSAAAAAAPVWQKYTFAYSDLATAATSNSITLFSLGAKQVIHGVVVKHETAFAGGSLSAYDVSVGVTGDLERYSSDFDVFQAVGSSTAQASQDLSPENFSTSTNILLSAVSVGDNLDQATAGSIDIWVAVATLP